MVDAVHLGKRHLVYCDDDGFGDGLRSVCELVGYPRPFAGNLLVAGIDGEREMTAPHQTISAIADLFAVVWPVFDPLLAKTTHQIFPPRLALMFASSAGLPSL
ncbi:hypothetical protein D3C71_1711400 [compost metagenome]